MIMRGNRDPRTTSPHHVFDYNLQAESASPAAPFTDKFHIINSRDHWAEGKAHMHADHTL